jgi:hypothetical protein
MQIRLKPYPELAKSLLSHIPEHIWKSNTTTFCDPTAGGGQKLRAIEDILRSYGHSEENIRGRVFGYEWNIALINYARNCNKVIANLSVIKYNDLLERSSEMKFDVTVGNPPYQDANNKAKNNKLWHKFVKAALKITKSDGYICMVTPSSIFNNSVGIGQWFYEQTQTKVSLVHAAIHENRQYFNVGVSTSDWVISKDRSVPSIEFPVVTDPIIKSITNKILSSTEFLDLVSENPTLTTADMNKGEVEIYYTGGKKTKVTGPVENGGLKIIYPFSASYKSHFITDMPSCHFNKVLYINSVEEGKNIISYTNSKLFRFYAATYRKTSGFTPAVKNKNLLPKLDNSKSWKDQEVYEHFNLTDEEITFVESYFVSNKKPKVAKEPKPKKVKKLKVKKSA